MKGGVYRMLTVHLPFIPYFPFSSVKFPGFGNYFPAKQCVLPYFWKKNQNDIYI